MLRRRGEPGAGPATAPGPIVHRYRMTEKLASIGDDFWIQNDKGERIFKVDGKAARVRDTLVIREAGGRELCKIQQRIARVKDSMEIEGPDGSRIALVQKAMITPLRDRFTAKIGDGPDLEVQGNIVDHEYTIGNIATSSKKWFRVRDSYGVEIAPGQNDALILAITVCIDQLTSDTH